MLAPIRAFLWRLIDLLRRHKSDGSFDRELESHLEMEIEENLRQGMNPEEARRRAIIALGGVDQTKDAYRETGAFRWLEVLMQDIRYGCRTFVRNPGFTAVAIATLALAIGGTAAMFSFVDAIMFKPLPYEDGDRMVVVQEKTPNGRSSWVVSAPNYLDWVKQNTVFEHLAAVAVGYETLTGIPEPTQVKSAQVTLSYFEMFGIKPFLGRAFASDEDQAGKEDVAIISHALWENNFGADRNILNQTILLNDKPYCLIGVLPAGGFFDRESVQLWRPLVFTAQNMIRNMRTMLSMGLLKRGVTLQQAQAQMNTIGARLASEYPDSNEGWGVIISSYAEAIFLINSNLRLGLLILISAAGMVLLIGCANLANLLMTRASGRSQEMALRASLGAGRWRLIRQLLTEDILLSICGGIVGIGVGYATMTALRAYAFQLFTRVRETEIAMDGRVLLFTLAISVLTGVFFGLAPAIQAARPDLAATVKEGTQGSSHTGRRLHLRRILVVAEIALAFMLLTGAGLLLRSLYSITSVDTGFKSDNVITARLPITSKQATDPAQLRAFSREMLAHVTAVPGVQAAALTSALPLQGANYMPYRIDGRPVKDRANQQACFFKMVTPSYFHVLGIPLNQGRELSESDVQGASLVTVINQTMAQQEFPNENPIGRSILVPNMASGKIDAGSEAAWEIVGVIKDEKIAGLNNEQRACMYVSNEQSPMVYMVNLVARTAMNPLTLVRGIRAAIHEVNKDQPLQDVKTLERIESDLTLKSRMETMLLGIFAGVAIVLAAVGIYGVTSYSVVQRTREMGIRAALGASPRDLLRMIIRGSLVLTVIGLALGACGAFCLTLVMRSILFGVSIHDPVTFVAVAVVLGGIAMLACYIPARRAAKIDPAVALRYE